MPEWIRPFAVLVTLMAILTASSRAAPLHQNDARLAVGIERQKTEMPGRSDRSKITTGILYDPRVSLVSRPELFDGRRGAPAHGKRAWRQLYSDLLAAAATELDFPPLQELKVRTRDLHSRQKAIPIATMNVWYNHPATEDQAYLLHPRMPETRPLAYPRRRLFTSAALSETTYRGRRVNFHLPRQLYFSNTPERVVGFEVDFDDGHGVREASFDQALGVSYSTTGLKQIRLAVVLDSGQILESRFNFQVAALATPAPHEEWTVTADIPYPQSGGTTAFGTAYIYRSEANAVLTRPIIVVEGFDIFNDMDWDVLYNKLNRQNLVDTLRSLERDLVVLNFNDPVNFVGPIQRNAMVVIKLIQMINAVKADPRPLTIIGASMGGLASRYALAYMEANGLSHDTDLFISFDAPQRGANIPLGLQHLLIMLSPYTADGDLVESADGPAARQMLVYHHSQTAAGTAGPHPWQSDLLSEMADLGSILGGPAEGYPRKTRNVAIANGSGTGMGLGFDPGDIILEASAPFGFLGGHARAVPDGQSTNSIARLSYGYELQGEVFIAGTLPYDNAPGGFTDTTGMVADFSNYLSTSNRDHCFIPTVSALGIATDNPFEDLSSDPAILDRTPFDAIYYPVDNQPHIEITAENAVWFLYELIHRKIKIQEELAGAINILRLLTLAREQPIDGLQLAAFDRNGSGTLDMADAAVSLQFAAELRDLFAEYLSTANLSIHTQ